MKTAAAAPAGAGYLVAGSERDPRGFAQRLRDAWAKYLTFRSTLAELRDLSDRQLLDIGIRRTMVKSFAIEAIYAK